MIIALDGPAGAGKSTVARRVAAALGLRFLDTGAMYRAVTLAALERGVDVADADACARVARSLALEVAPDGTLRVDGEAVEPAIRGPEVTRAVSTVAAHPAVREAIVAVQRGLAASGGGWVAEGRDTTTVVFPDADHKFFLDASERERARRRADELGRPLEEVLAEQRRRDALDAGRAVAPLVRAPDAHAVETDGLDVDEVVARVLAAVRGTAGPVEAAGEEGER